MATTPAIDRVVQQWVAGHHVHGVDRAALVLTRLGGTPVVLSVSVLVGVVAWRRSRRWPLLVACVAGEVAVEVAARVVKVAVGRPRPPFDQAVVVLANSSLPAAHVARALYAAALVWALVRSPRARRRAALVLGAVVVLVAWTRVELGAHWLTDTLAAVPLGLLAAVPPVRLLRRSPARGDQPDATRPPGPAGPAGRCGTAVPRRCPP
jgi:undecaprenyl-diphosphatase